MVCNERMACYLLDSTPKGYRNKLLISSFLQERIGKRMGDILLVCGMGMGIVFFGLVCIIILCSIMSAILKNSTAKKKEETAAAPAAATQPVQEAQIPNREEMVAALSAVIAEELGKDVSAIRIVSLKKL